MTATKTTQTKPEPPAQAVAADAHWAATREKLRNRQRPIAVLTICDDPDVKKALEDARFLVRRLTASLESEPDDAELARDLATAQQALDAAQTDFDEAAIMLRFQALRRPDWEDLKAKHPPTEAQAEDNLVVNVDTLGPELIAASSLDGITADDAKYYLEEWGDGEASALFNTAWHVQSNARMELGKG
ncbi:MAG: hypothetical protein HOW71_44875 [Nonomuraea sp.]|nr:hypothetical protein [Nonomuraea sp.]NUQ95868.1 hypothetical protein [Streptomyces sp.]NUS15498.1 hypothetical protein [Streptomyces sp.]NUS24043.1 hypothetical protein [Streptomyces sp.]